MLTHAVGVAKQSKERWRERDSASPAAAGRSHSTSCSHCSFHSWLYRTPKNTIPHKWTCHPPKRTCRHVRCSMLLVANVLSWSTTRLLNTGWFPPTHRYCLQFCSDTRQYCAAWPRMTWTPRCRMEGGGDEQGLHSLLGWSSCVPITQHQLIEPGCVWTEKCKSDHSDYVIPSPITLILCHRPTRSPAASTWDRPQTLFWANYPDSS
jgi:hypothetical protein